MKNLCKLIQDKEGKITHQVSYLKDKDYVSSYASTYDDVIIYNLLGGKKNGFYIDVGAFDPNSGSNTKMLYELGWSGINIEPNENIFLKIVKYRPRDINLNYAVSDVENKEIIFYQTCNDSWGDKAHEQSTIMKEVAVYRNITSINTEYKEVYNVYALGKEWQKHMEILQEKGDRRFIKEFKVSTVTLAQICHQFCKEKEIDYLSIDVEGAEHLVLNGGDFNIFRPKIIECEDNKPYMKRESISTLLASFNYTLIFEDAIGVNKYFARNEDLTRLNTSLEQLFLYPLDRFIRENNFDAVIYCLSDLSNYYEFSEESPFNKAIIVGFLKKRGDKIHLNLNLLAETKNTEQGILLSLNDGKKILFYEVYTLDEIF